MTCALLLLLSPARAEDLHLVLELQRLENGEVTDRLSLYASEVDPNISAVDDRFRLTHNGKRIRVPDTFLAALNHARRGYSYDTFTKGIESSTRKALCKMAGPAIGEVLYVRYLTYDASSVLSSHDMRPVLSDATNCLFEQIIHPRAVEARLEATKALASLQTLRTIKGR
jgi:hypothetical protein